MTKHGEFNWNELQTSDPARAMRFYSACLNWTFEAEQMPAGGTYWLCLAGGKPVCGILTVDTLDQDRWIVFVHVDGIDDAVDQVRARGGDILRAPWDVPGVGRIAMIRDPGGAEIGWITPV